MTRTILYLIVLLAASWLAPLKHDTPPRHNIFHHPSVTPTLP